MKHSWIFLFATAAAACGGTSHEAGPQPAAALAVQAVAIRSESLAETFEAGGTVRARTVAVILSSRIMSPVLQIEVAPGDRVRRGQPLVRLDARQLESSAASAEAAVANAVEGATAAQADEAAAEAALGLASATHQRISRLHERNSATTGELDEATAALRAAEARMKAAQARRAASARAIEAARGNARGATVGASYSTLTAPFDGLVTETPAQVGMMAAPGVPLVTVEDTRKYRLEVSVDATRAGAIAVGTRVPVTLAGSTDALEGPVAEMAESVDAFSHAFVVKIDLPASPALRSGLFGRARFPGVAVRGIAVPASAVVRRGQVSLVFTEEGGVARMRLVQVAGDVDGRVRVLAGLADGDRVILNPPAELTDGRAVVASGQAPGRAR